jgi:choline dehydrogenase-like flavoprotein
MHETPTLLVFTAHEAQTAEAIFARMFPATAGEPGVAEIGVISYIDRALSDAYASGTELYRHGLTALDRVAEQRYKTPLADCTPAQQDALIGELERGGLPDIMEGKAEEILRAMGATSTWHGPRFTGVGSSHELGGCRMGHEPSTSVVNADLAVHNTPGLYVCSGAVCPSCPGINPTLTLWALCVRAADRLAARLRSGEEL